MIAEIITIGDEILIGQVVDTNSAWMAVELNRIGIKVHQITSISDEKEHIIKTLRESLERADIILMTGGLGPTNDDITKKTLAEYFESEMEIDQDVLSDIEALVAKRSGTMNELNYQQALVPKKCSLIRNPIGTAPIMWFEQGRSVLVAMPGVPFEMKHAMKHEVLPRLAKHFKTPSIVHKTIITTGISESALAQKLEKFEAGLPSNLKLAYLPTPGLIRLRMSIFSNNENESKRIIDEKTKELQQTINEYIWGYDSDTFELVVGRLLLEKKASLATAESCTGGTIAKLITSVPGSSAYFKGSVVAYDNAVKLNILGVKHDTLTHYGAVSQQVVEQMAVGVMALLETDYAIASSGIAGPDGGTEEKPVGTTWLAVASKNGVFSKRFNFGDSREHNTTKASASALNFLREVLLSE